jgi:retinol dehydrogenase-12
VVVVAGASSGIGAAAAVELARLGATVLPVGRNRARLEAVARKARVAGSGGSAKPLVADFASLAAVRRLAEDVRERHPSMYALVNNAGLVAGKRTSTPDGHELTLQVNHLAPFLLTNLLLDSLRASPSARVVTTSSDAHSSGRIDLDDLDGERRWSAWSAYSNSKLANILFTRALARRLSGTAVTANCLHPGVIRTRLGRGTRLPIRVGWRLVSTFFKGPRRGVSTIVHLTSAPQGAAISGGYFVDSHPATPSKRALDDALGEQLWEASERLVGLA